MKTLGLINPSSPAYSNLDMDAIRHWFENKGWKIKEADNLFKTDRFLAGSDEQRAYDIHQMFKDKEVEMIVALKGGYGSGRLLDLLDYKCIKDNSKPLIGFSDTTALQLALWAKTGLTSYTGLSPRRDITSEGVNPLIDTSFSLFLAHKLFSVELKPLHTESEKDITATLVGGTLSLITELIGTPYCPDYTDTLLFIEDVGEEPYKVDRMLTQLRLSGILDKVKGLIWGDFYKCISSDKEDGTLEQVLLDLHKRMPNLKIWAGLPYGHSDSRIILPIGGKVQIKSGKTLLISY